MPGSSATTRQSASTPLGLSPQRWLRLAAAAVWIATALLVAAPSYRAIGASYLARLGLPAEMMYLACSAELALGIWIALRPPTWWDTLGQLGAVVFFTLALAIAEPMLLVSPFGMLSKNLPVMAVIAAAYLIEREDWAQRAWWILRGGVAVIWITEGLLPKILFQQEIELEMARQSSLAFFEAGTFVALLGAGQVLSGILVLVLPAKPLRLLLGAQALALVLLPVFVIHHYPALLLHPFAPLIKNLPILVATALLMRRSRN